MTAPLRAANDCTRLDFAHGANGHFHVVGKAWLKQGFGGGGIQAWPFGNLTRRSASSKQVRIRPTCASCFFAIVIKIPPHPPLKMWVPKWETLEAEASGRWRLESPNSQASPQR